MSKNPKASLFKVIFLSASGFFLFVCMDSTAKYLGSVMPVTQAVWGRFFFHFIALCVYFLLFKPKLNLTRNFKIQIVRSLLMVTATFFMFNSLQRFDLVDIYVVFFSAPLIVSLLSAYFLKDILSPKGIILMLLSFGNNEPFSAVFYTAVTGALIFTIYISFNWTPIENNFYWIGLVAMGIFGFISHFIIIYAIQLSNLSFVTNFQYSQLLWSTIINFLIFGVPADISKIIGLIGIIIFGVMFIRVEGSKKVKKVS